MWWIVASILAVGDPNAPELAPPVQVQAGGQPINVDMGHAALLNAPFVAKPAKKFGKINILSLSSAHLQGRDPRRPSGCPGPLAKDPRRHPPRDRSAARNRSKLGLSPREWRGSRVRRRRQHTRPRSGRSRRSHRPRFGTRRARRAWCSCHPRPAGSRGGGW